jgi:hypothetical protein
MKAKMMMKKAEKSSKKDAMPMKMKDGKKVPIFMNKGGKAGCYSKGGGVPSTVQVRGMGAARGRVAKIR